MEVTIDINTQMRTAITILAARHSTSVTKVVEAALSAYVADLDIGLVLPPRPEPGYSARLRQSRSLQMDEAGIVVSAPPMKRRNAEPPQETEFGPAEWRAYGATVRETRTHRDLSVKDLAGSLATSKRNIERIEAGEAAPAGHVAVLLGLWLMRQEEAKPQA
ncbi:MAG: helix-turn-helix domain-containing protein [Chloroflexota bacterium]